MNADFWQREIISIKKEIDEEHVAALNPLLNNDVKDDIVLKAVISEYLSHECYTESAKAFAEDLKVEAASFGIPNHSQARLRDEVDDHHAITRQRRSSVDFLGHRIEC